MILALFIMMLDKRVAAIDQVRAALSMPLAPLQYAVSWPIHLIENIRNSISAHDTLVKENLDLRAEQLLLRAQVQRLLAIESENNQLKSLAHTSAQIQGKVMVAELLAVATDPFVNQVVLDKGGRDNVFVGQPVLDANGVMGQIIRVGPLTSHVLLINDVHSGIAVQVARNGVRAIAVGDPYTGNLRLLNVPQTADIQVHDIVVTSGLGEHFPEGYPVGQIISIVRDPGLQFATITVEALAHLDKSREVLLVWPISKPLLTGVHT